MIDLYKTRLRQTGDDRPVQDKTRLDCARLVMIDLYKTRLCQTGDDRPVQDETAPDW